MYKSFVVTKFFCKVLATYNSTRSVMNIVMHKTLVTYAPRLDRRIRSCLFTSQTRRDFCLDIAEYRNCMTTLKCLRTCYKSWFNIPFATPLPCYFKCATAKAEPVVPPLACLKLLVSATLSYDEIPMEMQC